MCSIKTPAARGTIYCMNCKVLVTGSIYRSFNRKVYLLALRRNLPVLINNEHEIPRQVQSANPILFFRAS